MTREDKRQQELPYGAAQGTYDERRLKVGMTIGAMYDPDTGALRQPYAGAPVMELRVLMLLMLEAEARGRLLAGDEMVKPPWGLLCSERTIRRIIKFGQDLGILRGDRRLDTGQQKFTKVWRIDWDEVTRFIRSHSPGQVGQSPGQIGQTPGQVGQSPGQIGQNGEARTCSSSLFLNTKDDDVVVFRNEASTKREGDWPNWPNEPRGTTGRDRACIGSPESAKPTPHEGAAATRLVSDGPRRAESIDVTRLVGLVRQCGVYAADQAVSAAIRHGHDVLALVEGWWLYCRPGWDAQNEAVKRLYYRLIDPPMGLEPHEGWVVQHPHRIRSPEADQRQEVKVRAAAADLEQKAAEASRAAKARSWLRSLAAAEAHELLEQFFAASADIVAKAVRKDRHPLENGLFLLWVLKHHGAKFDDH